MDEIFSKEPPMPKCMKRHEASPAEVGEKPKRKYTRRQSSETRESKAEEFPRGMGGVKSKTFLQFFQSVYPG